MGDIVEKKVMGWYGKCPECEDLELHTLGDARYLIGSIYRVKGVQWDSPWEPGEKSVETTWSGGVEQYDKDHNPLFTKLECGNAYLIVNPDENTITIPNFEKDGGLVTEGDGCCGAKPIELMVNCKCSDASCENPSVEECEGWTEDEIFNACQHLRTDPDAEEWSESLGLWYDPLLQGFLGEDTQFHKIEDDVDDGVNPDTSVLSGNYVHVKSGNTHSFMQLDASGKVTDVIPCDFADKVMSIKSCKHDDYGWILMVKEGAQGVYRPVYTHSQPLSAELMPGASPVEVVDVPAGWTVQKTGNYIDGLTIATAITEIWGDDDGGTRYLTIGDADGPMHTVYYHTDSNPVGSTTDASCENPDVGDTSKTELTENNLICFDGQLNDGTPDAKCVLPITDCCSNFEFRHTVSTTPAEYDCATGDAFPITVDGETYEKEDCAAFHEKFFGADKQCCEGFGEMELRKHHGDFHQQLPEWDVKYMCHNDIQLSESLMDPVPIRSKYLSWGQTSGITAGHGLLGFTYEVCGEVVVTLKNGECMHTCVKDPSKAAAAGEEIWFVPIDQDLDCSCS